MCSSFIFVSVTGWSKETQEGKEFIWLTIPSSEFLREVKAGTQPRAERNGSLPFSFCLTHMMQEPLCLGDGGCLINYQDNILQTYPQANLI